MVTKIDLVGGKLEGPDAQIRKNETPNPKGSIQARIITDGANRAIPEKDLPVFWPFFPYDLMPIKEGEHVYVIFEDNNNKSHGLWLTRIPESNKVDKLNLVPGEKKYEDNEDNDYNNVNVQKSAQASESPNLTQPKQSEDFAKEDIPPFTARVGDRAIHGSNNTLILLSRDRIDEPNTGEKEESGTILMVTGRKDAEKLNLKEDKSYVLISSKTDVDDNLGINAGSSKKGVATIALKSDEIRISARKGMKIVVEDSNGGSGDIFIVNKGKMTIETDKEINIKSKEKIVLDCNAIEVGTNGEKAVLGDTMKGLISDYITDNTTHTHPSAMGPTGPSVDLIPAKIKATIKLEQSLSNSVKIGK